MLELSVITVIIIVTIYIWLTWNHNHWKNLNIPYLEPELLFGNIKDFVLMKRCKGVVYDELHRKSSEPALGIFVMRKPQLLIRDPALVKIITTNEFNNFQENDLYSEQSDFFYSTNIFFYAGEKWKKNRGILTPALSIAKLKQFFPYLVEISRSMITYLQENDGEKFEAKQFSSLFTTESSMSYVYGVKCDSFKNPNSEYMKSFQEIFKPSWWQGFKFSVANAFPSIGHFLKIGITPKTFVSFFTNVVEETVNYRKKNKILRKDFLQFLIDRNEKDGAEELSVYEMTGLSMNIVADAAETSSFAMAVLLDALIRYPEEQAKLRQEIDSKIQSFDDMTFEDLSSLPYLQAFIFESLRILTPFPLHEKRCTNDCEFFYKGKQYKFKKADKIAISVYSIHRDPDYFPSPEEFKPDRFLQGDEFHFTFGSGPRTCIGRIFAQLQMKIFLCALLKHFEILPKEKLAPKIEFDPNSMAFLMIKGGVWFRVKKRLDLFA